MRYAKPLGVLIFATTLSSLVYGQLGAAAGGFADAQQRELERQHQLQMQREDEQTALEIARIQAQNRAAQAAQQQPVQPPYFWESGNAFLQGCAASLEKAEQPNTETNAEMDAVIACSSFLRGLIEGTNLGVQFAQANTKATSPQPRCMPENVTPIQSGLVLVKYVRAHPETAHQKTVLLSLLALREAFACKTTESKAP